ncbi:hypothetical protein, partial [Rhodoferax sp.]|uniref:hypothetical protein n=1 Tax=Rhodoferax sp. TaxID=50421 RepID=UPI00275A8546|nr:hypothetical protein [Rhodoferax sp.]
TIASCTFLPMKNQKSPVCLHYLRRCEAEGRGSPRWSAKGMDCRAVFVIARSSSDAAIHAARSHGLLHCVRNDDVLSR